MCSYIDTQKEKNMEEQTWDLEKMQKEANAEKKSEETLQKIFDEMPPEEILYDLAEIFKIFGDSTRIKILYTLFESELCVRDIAEILNMSQNAVSHQLRVLKNNKLVRFRKEGKNVYYSLADDHVYSIIKMGMEHLEE